MLTLYAQVTSGAYCKVTSNFSVNLISGPCIGSDFAATIFFSWSVDCSSRAFELFTIGTTPAYLIRLSCPNFLTYLFLFFLQEYKVFGFITVSLFSFLSLFLSFLIQLPQTAPL